MGLYQPTGNIVHFDNLFKEAQLLNDRMNPRDHIIAQYKSTFETNFLQSLTLPVLKAFLEFLLLCFASYVHIGHPQQVECLYECI